MEKIRGKQKMKNYLSLVLIIFLLNTLVLPQRGSREKPANYYEIKIGGELNRAVPSFGISRNFYLSPHLSISPEIILMGTPFFSGTLRINIPIGSKLQISPHAGFGLTPVGLPFSEAGIIGINISYSLNRKIKLFIEPRI